MISAGRAKASRAPLARRRRAMRIPQPVSRCAQRRACGAAVPCWSRSASPAVRTGEKKSGVSMCDVIRSLSSDLRAGAKEGVLGFERRRPATRHRPIRAGRACNYNFTRSLIDILPADMRASCLVCGRTTKDARRPARQPRTTAVDLRLSLVDSAGRSCPGGAPSDADDELPSSEVTRAAGAVGGAARAHSCSAAGTRCGAAICGICWPSWRACGRRTSACARSGHGVTTALAQRLRAAGVQRLHVPFHCARQDAHDWLVGQAGALKTAHRAIRACLEAELPVVAEIVLTRPTAPHLAETVEVLARLGVRSDLRAAPDGARTRDGTEFVPLSPRLDVAGKQPGASGCGGPAARACA